MYECMYYVRYGCQHWWVLYLITLANRQISLPLYYSVPDTARETLDIIRCSAVCVCAGTRASIHIHIYTRMDMKKVVCQDKRAFTGSEESGKKTFPRQEVSFHLSTYIHKTHMNRSVTFVYVCMSVNICACICAHKNMVVLSR